MPNDHDILLAVERTKARVKMADTVTGLLWLLAAVMTFLLTVIAVDQAAPLARAVRLHLLAALAVSGAAGLAVVLLIPTLRRVNDLYAVRLIERQADDLFRNSLVSYLELRDDPGVDPAIREAVAAKAACDLRAVDLETLVDRRPMRVAAVVLAAVAALVIVFAATTPKSFGSSLGRAMGFEVAAPTATQILRVRPESPASIVAGDPLVLGADLDGELPAKVTVAMTFDGTYWDAVPMQSADRRHWELKLEAVERDLRFVVRAGDARSDEHLVKVIPLPAVTQVRTHLVFPDYTLRSPATIDDGNVEALVGTRVDLTAEVSGTPAQPPNLVWSGGPGKTSLAPAGQSRQWRGSFIVTGDDSYAVQYLDQVTGRENVGAVRYRVRALPDRPPRIDLSSTAGTVTVPAGGSATLGLRAADDYGLDRLALSWRKAGGEAKTIVLKTYPRDRAVLQDTDSIAVRVADLGLASGDEAWVRFAVADRLPTGPQEGLSEEVHIVVGQADPQQNTGQGTSAAETVTSGGQPKDGAGPGGGAAGQNQSLSEQERRDLEKMRQQLEKLRAAMNQAGRGDAGQGQTPGAGGEKDATGTEPAKTKPPESSGNQGENSGQKVTSGGPAASADPADRTRPKDADLGQRPSEFSETGRFAGGPMTDRQLAQTVGAELRKLDRALRDGAVDPKLLKDLGWTEADVQQFVSRYQDRYGTFAAQGTSGAPAEPTPSAAVTSAAGGPGTVGSGTVSAAGTAGDDVTSAAGQGRRTDSPFARIIDAYTRSVSRDQTADQ